jgi:diaminopimelate epimerase
MRFVKMHGIGNDYVYVDAVTEPALEKRDLAALARTISDRHTGVGSDGLILLCRPTLAGAHVRMRMFNADGSESEMCGNGIRCVAKFAHDRLGIAATPMRVETGRGILGIDYTLAGGRVASATVDMGEPILELEKIPVDTARVRETPKGYSLPGFAAAQDWRFVSMGNPHAVSWDFAADGKNFEPARRATLAELCPQVETNPAFPRRINVHLVHVISPREARMVTWERGAGFTQACGTGACAVLVASARTGRLDRKALLHLPGGDLEIAWDAGTGHVFMTGPATDVFEGDWPD